MGLPEGFGGLESVAEQAIDADVVEPDQGVGQQGVVASGQGYSGGAQVGVDGVVAACAPARSGVIAEHGQVGGDPRRRSVVGL